MVIVYDELIETNQVVPVCISGQELLLDHVLWEPTVLQQLEQLRRVDGVVKVTSYFRTRCGPPAACALIAQSSPSLDVPSPRHHCALALLSASAFSRMWIWRCCIASAVSSTTINLTRPDVLRDLHVVVLPSWNANLHAWNGARGHDDLDLAVGTRCPGPGSAVAPGL